MASAWGKAWGKSFGAAWGSVAQVQPPVITPTRGAAGLHFVYPKTPKHPRSRRSRRVRDADIVLLQRF